QKQPVVMPQMVAAYEFSTSHPKQIVIVGERGDVTTEAILKEVHSRFIPNKVLLLLDGDEVQQQLAELNGFYSSLSAAGGKSTAYICENYLCRLPTSDPIVVAELLDKRE
ncbi:MAG: thioredoxin domain-containing protein, partial [Bacteroidota bacterium]